MTHFLIWLDNYIGQFNSDRIFYWLSRQHRKTNIQHTKIFFEVGHGKGEHDGVGACVKKAFCREKLRFEGKDKLKNAREIIEWCDKYLYIGSNHNSKIRHFF